MKPKLTGCELYYDGKQQNANKNHIHLWLKVEKIRKRRRTAVQNIIIYDDIGRFNKGLRGRCFCLHYFLNYFCI